MMAAKAVERGTMNSVTQRRVREHSGQGLSINPANSVNGKWISRKMVADPNRNNAPVIVPLRNRPKLIINKSGYTTHDGTRPSVKVKTRPPSRLVTTARTRI
jgi:hypothetical protein